MMRTALATLPALLLLAACQGESAPEKGAAPAAPAVREPLIGGPYPALLLTQAQFVEQVGADGTKSPVPGPARLVIMRATGDGWQAVTLEDPESNTFHKALPFDGGVLTIGANGAALKVWRFRDGAWQEEAHWRPTFGGRFNRLRDVERGDVDGDGRDELVIATHDQGVIAVVHPDENWRVEEIDRQPSTFVHEIEIGDVDGDGHPEILATPSKPNKLGEEQSGEVVMFRRADGGWTRTVVDAPSDTHAKEILVADVTGDGVAELLVVWEGAVGKDGALLRPVTIREYAFRGTPAPVATTVATVPDRQMRALVAGDVNADGAVDLVGTSLKAGVWLFERIGASWKRTAIDEQSSGFEHPVHLADLDGDGTLEIYVAAEDQQAVRRHRWGGRTFETVTLFPLRKGDITWNIGDARL
jgi:hypothetical protein